MSPIIGAELLQNASHVHSDGFTRDGKLCRHLLVAIAPCDRLENLDLARCQSLPETGRDSLERHRTRYRPAACLHLANRADEIAAGRRLRQIPVNSGIQCAACVEATLSGR